MLGLWLVKFVWFVLKVKVDGYPVLGHGFNVLIASQHKLRFDLISSARFFQPSTSLAEQFQNWMEQKIELKDKLCTRLIQNPILKETQILHSFQVNCSGSQI